MNKVLLSGRMGKDADISYTSNGNAVCTLSVVTSDNKKQQDGTWKEENKQWHTIKVWGVAGERAASLKKGSGVFVDGDIRYESWEKDGVTKYKTVIHSFRVEGLTRLNKDETVPKAPQPDPEPQPEQDDDFPF